MAQRQQRLVLRINAGRKVNVSDFRLFLRELEKLEIPGSSEIEIHKEDDGTEYYYLPIPTRRKSRKVAVPQNSLERTIVRAQDRRDNRNELAQMNGHNGTANGSAPKRTIRIPTSALVRVKGQVAVRTALRTIKEMEK